MDNALGVPEVSGKSEVVVGKRNQNPRSRFRVISRDTGSHF
jgi:hypothetical protein